MGIYSGSKHTLGYWLHRNWFGVLLYCFPAISIQYETLRWIAGVVSNLRCCQHEALTCALTLASAPKAGMLYNVRNATACDLRHRFLKHRGELLFEGLSWSLRLLSEAV